jgi:hypothetical protein
VASPPEEIRTNFPGGMKTPIAQIDCDGLHGGTYIPLYISALPTVKMSTSKLPTSKCRHQ